MKPLPGESQEPSRSAAVRFPPEPDPSQRDNIDLLLGGLACALESRSASYIAGPVTTGPLFLKWYSVQGRALVLGSDEFRARRHEAVVIPNVARGTAAASEFRASCSGAVIEPFSFHLPQWTQDDYRFFWGRVIECFARRVVLLEGWSSSNGAVFECYTGLRLGLDVVAEGCILTSTTVPELIRAELATLRDATVDTRFLERLIAEVSSLS